MVVKRRAQPSRGHCNQQEYLSVKDMRLDWCVDSTIQKRSRFCGCMDSANMLSAIACVSHNQLCPNATHTDVARSKCGKPTAELTTKSFLFSCVSRWRFSLYPVMKAQSQPGIEHCSDRQKVTENLSLKMGRRKWVPRTIFFRQTIQ